MMHPEHRQSVQKDLDKEEKEKKKSFDVPDLVTVSSHQPNSTSHNTKTMMSPSSLNEQILQAMQLCTNPYLNPVPGLPTRDLMSPNSSFPGFHSSPFKTSSPSSPMKSCMLMSSAP